MNIFKFMAFGAVALSLAGCATLSRTDFPVEAELQAAEIPQNVSIVRLTPQNIASYSHPKREWHPDVALPTSSNWQYLVGVGDVLSITVWDHPELNIPAGPARSSVESGSWVNAQGKIFYPYIGDVTAAGRTIGDIQKELTERLQEFIPDPQIEVKVADFNSQKVVITGAVMRAGTVEITNIPVSLLEAVNSTGGLAPTANSNHVTINRRGHTYYVHLRDYLAGNSHGDNPVLQGGDIVNIPVRENNVAYVLGQVTKPGAVNLGIDGVNLTDALTTQGGLQEQTADAKGIFVFRTKPGNRGFDVYQLDASTPLAFVLATKFVLHPQDVVYVVTDPAAQWNSVIANLAPSISAFRGIQVIENSFP